MNNKKIVYILLLFLVVFSLSFVLTVSFTNFTSYDGPNNYHALADVDVTNGSVEILEPNPSSDARCKVYFEVDLDDIDWYVHPDSDDASDELKIKDFLKSNTGKIIEKGESKDDGWSIDNELYLQWSTGPMAPFFKLEGNLTIEDNKLIFSGYGYNDTETIGNLNYLDPGVLMSINNPDKNSSATIEFKIDKNDFKLN